MDVFTWSLFERSASSPLVRSTSVALDTNSCSWASSFFLLCSDSVFACCRPFTSQVNSLLSFSRLCLLFSRLALNWERKKKYGLFSSQTSTVLWIGQHTETAESEVLFINSLSNVLFTCHTNDLDSYTYVGVEIQAPEGTACSLSWLVPAVQTVLPAQSCASFSFPGSEPRDFWSPHLSPSLVLQPLALAWSWMSDTRECVRRRVQLRYDIKAS